MIRVIETPQSGHSLATRNRLKYIIAEFAASCRQQMERRRTKHLRYLSLKSVSAESGLFRLPPPRNRFLSGRILGFSPGCGNDAPCASEHTFV